MVNLCEELLDFGLSNDILTTSIKVFAKAVNSHLQKPFNGQIPSKKTIDCLRKSVTRLRELHDVSLVFTTFLLARFRITLSDDDHNEGMAILDKIITFRGPGDTPSPWQNLAFESATVFSQTLFRASPTPNHLEQVIKRTRDQLNSPKGPDRRTAIIKQLSEFEKFRSYGSSHIANAQNILPSTSESVQLSSFRDLITSLPELDPVKPVSETTFIKHFNALKSAQHLTDLEDIQDGVKYCRQLLGSYPSSTLAGFTRFTLGNLSNRAFECTDEIEYLNEAISVARDNINTSNEQGPLCLTLISFLTTRLKLQPSSEKEDLAELMELFPIAAKNRDADSLRMSPVSCQWAFIARCFGHPSIPIAYNCAISLIQASLTFAPTLDTQHPRLIKMSREFKTLPSAYASYLIHFGHVERAIEVLEQGRTLLWSEMRGLRTSMDQIRLVDSSLADR